MNNVIDIKTRKPAERIDIDENLPMSKYFDTWKRRAKEENIESLLIISVNKDSNINWDIKEGNFYHLLQLYIELEVMKDIIYGMIYPDDEEEYDVELDE